MHLKKKHLYAAGVVLLIAGIGIAAFFLLPKKVEANFLDENGGMLMPHRETAKYKVLPSSEDSAEYSVAKVVFESAGWDVYALLLEPKKFQLPRPGVVLLPGAGVSKEAELPVAREIAKLGYAVIVPDYRGLGETGGVVPTLEGDYNNFLEGKISVQHLFIVDALIAADVLSTRESVDPNNIILMGESFGGRIALIAAAIDPRMKGAVAISAAGFHYMPQDDPNKDKFLASLDADTYVPKISPRQLIMIHNEYDKSVPIGSAIVTFEKAKDPKLFITINNTECSHGYCSTMLWPLNYSLGRVARS
jgi:dienelactone hydrolase